MYIHVEQKVTCSNCGCVNNYEDATRRTFNGSKTIRRCLNPNCKHETVISEFTTNSNNTDTTVYRSNSNNEQSF